MGRKSAKIADRKGAADKAKGQERELVNKGKTEDEKRAWTKRRRQLESSSAQSTGQPKTV